MPENKEFEWENDEKFSQVTQFVTERKTKNDTQYSIMKTGMLANFVCLLLKITSKEYQKMGTLDFKIALFIFKCALLLLFSFHHEFLKTPIQ